MPAAHDIGLGTSTFIALFDRSKPAALPQSRGRPE
jgi:hypothetical protein